MNKKQFVSVVLVALVAGFAGGMISDKLATAKALNSALEDASNPQWACKFIVVKNKNSLASVILEDKTASLDKRTQLVFFDDRMHQRIILGLNANHQPFMRMLDAQENTIWQAP